MSDIKERNKLLPNIAYWPTQKWYREWTGQQTFAPGEKLAIPSVRFEPSSMFDLEPKLYIWREVPQINTAKRIAYIKLRQGLEELHERRSVEIRRLTAPVEVSIEASRKILQIEENWDGEGGRGYSEVTWKRAIKFVRDIATPFVVRHRKQIQPPKITAGPDGSIDVRWTSEKRTMLLNFPVDESMPPDFFGHDKGQDVIKGTLDLTSQNHWLLLWLTR